MSERSDTDYVAGHVEEALAHTGETDAHVHVARGRILITGTVLTEERRDAITAIAAAVAGDLDVHNEVTVLDVREPDDEEELA